jgi:hypothetical protein
MATMKRRLSVLAGGWLVAALALQGIAVADETKSTEAAKPEAAPATDQKPSATLELESDQVRLIMGGTAGKGTLHYQGKDYPFTFKTASAGLGLKVTTSVSATGEVFSLSKVEDFAGQYSAVSQAALAGSSEKTATYKSDKGVVVKLRATVKGAGISFGAGVATIKMVEK